MSKQSIVEVEATYMEQLETDNFKLYKQVQELKAENLALRKDLEVMTYQARLHKAQSDILIGTHNPIYPEADDNPMWEPDSIEREEGL